MRLLLYKNFPINDYTDQIYYSKESDRDKAFDTYIGLDIKELASCDKTAQTIRLDINYYQGNKYNYGCMVEENKRYYIFIDSVEWKSNLKTCILHYSYDYWQTYCYNVNFKNSYIERMHVTDDTFGKWLIDEGLPVFYYKTKASDDINGYGTTYGLSVSDTSILYTGMDYDDNIPSLVRPSINECSSAILYSNSIKSITNAINTLVKLNKKDAINGVYVFYGKVPFDTGYVFFDGDEDTVQSDALSNVFFARSSDSEADISTITKSKLSTIDGYTPKNNKCFMYPYNFVYITNNNGSNLIGKFELTNDKHNISFAYYFPITEGGNSFGYLKNYDNVIDNFDYSINGLVNPELPYITNTYQAYLSANINTLTNQIAYMEYDAQYQNIKNGASAVGSILSGNIAGGVTDFVTNSTELLYNTQKGIDGLTASLNDIASKPNLQSGKFTGNACSITGNNGFKIQIKQIPRENVELIDNYFEMYGYKVCLIDTPKLNTRPYWNYLKTVNVNVVANIPQDALSVIKSMFDSGVTLWHNIDNMYDYSKYNH